MRIKKTFKKQKVNSRQIDAIYAHKQTVKRRAIQYKKKLNSKDTLNHESDSSKVRKIKKQTMHLITLDKYAVKDSVVSVLKDYRPLKLKNKPVILQVRISQPLRKYDPLEWVKIDLPVRIEFRQKILIVEGHHANSFQHQKSREIKKISRK